MWPFSSESKADKTERLLKSWNVSNEDLEDGLWRVDENTGGLIRVWGGLTEARVRRIVREELAKSKEQ